MDVSPDLDTARRLDDADPLSQFRDRFHLPTTESGDALIYLCGNSLGLQPKTVRDHIEVELEDWAAMGVEGHFEGRNPWYSYHERFTDQEAAVVGALPREVVVMNSLTTNLHLMMVSFYRPTAERFGILIDQPAFPSDEYAVASQANVHGFDPSDAIFRVSPRNGEHTLRTEDIVAAIERDGERIALVMLAGVNYYTGQAYDLRAVTQAAHAMGCLVGVDLAHAAGNLELRLHEDGVDFGVWCTYKYLNSGPGGVSGAFVHDRHAVRPDLPRFAGWWGNDPATRFEMAREFVPQSGAGGWQLSNAPVLTMAAHKASLDIFAEATMAALRAKSVKLTGYLESLLDGLPEGSVEVITPRDPDARGCQLSLLASGDGRVVQKALQDAGVVCDFRPPNVIRVAPVPLYNTFEDVWRFVEVLRNVATA